ncbi:MAG: sugar O-acyltransferase (sialic acid O-acetyltransferase NeuD family) [Paraglaciecola sp.]|jgi:sugar O-acyltransferase (sialic acid O-acetyltransferase NeuD family)
MPTKLLLVGASGHAKVIIEAVQASKSECHIYLSDQDIEKRGRSLLGDTIIHALCDWSDLPELYHISIGNNLIRKQLSDLAKSYGKIAYTVIHPLACISPSATIGPGCFIAAKSIIGPEVTIEAGCIINHGAVVDHDCQIGAYSHVAPNSTLGGGVKVGEVSLIGSGSTVLPMVNIGRSVTIGAGAVITTAVADNQTMVGIPGRQIINEE